MGEQNRHKLVHLAVAAIVTGAISVSALPASASASSTSRVHGQASLSQSLRATVGIAYSKQLVAHVKSGHRGEVRWVDVKNLPPGLTLSSRGKLSGTPTKAGSWTTTYGVRLAVKGSRVQRGTIAWTVKTPTLAQQLVSAPVPSVCGHPAGTLVNGKLPGIPTGQGAVTLHKSADGSINGVTGAAAVATLECNTGGVDWPETLAIYGAGPTLLASIDLGDVKDSTLGTGDQTLPVRLTVANGKAVLDWVTQQADDPDSTPTLAYSASFAVSGSTVVVSDLLGTTEVPTATTFRDAVAAKNLAKAAAVSSRSIAKAAIAGAGGTLGSVSCYGVLSTSAPSYVKKVLDTASDSTTYRVCAATTTGGRAMVVGMKFATFRDWKVTWVRFVKVG